MGRSILSLLELGFADEVGELAENKELIEVYAYHCYRCNYTWLPRDFDFNRRPSLKEGAKAEYFGEGCNGLTILSPNYILIYSTLI